jgi:negative regulator of flagellin synthesis FlgM
MRIGERQFIAAEKSETVDSKRSEKRTASKKGEVSADSVSLSSKAKEVADIVLALKAAPDVRENLVNEIRAKIESGNYSASGKDIVQKILNETA